MHPPETEPTNDPSLSITSWLPIGRGEDPQVLITVAMATSLPSLIQLKACCYTLSALVISTIAIPQLFHFYSLMALRVITLIK